jgi:CRP-like cAMP-binding protein
MWKFLQGLSEEHRELVLRTARRRKFAAGEVIVHEGDPADSLFLIRSGRAAAGASTEYGNVATFSVMGPGDVFGELALLSPDRVRTATVRALEPTEALVLSRHEFDRLRREVPAANDALLALLTDMVTRLSRQLVEALNIPADVRIRRRLAELCRLYGDGRPGTVVPLTQDDLAGLAGATRSTVNRVLSREVKRGSVRLQRGRMTIVDPDALGR